MKRICSALVLLACCAASGLAADGDLSPKALNPQALLKPLAAEWPTFNGDYTGKRYSRLAQINQDNVQRLTLAWVLQPQSVGIKSMPLEVNGLLYFTTPDNIWSADARTGRIV
ncbi:MAG TPA: acido-empty-quinoprotein group A, partial [Bryobacteraceae bacterium]